MHVIKEQVGVRTTCTRSGCCVIGVLNPEPFVWESHTLTTTLSCSRLRLCNCNVINKTTSWPKANVFFVRWHFDYTKTTFTELCGTTERRSSREMNKSPSWTVIVVLQSSPFVRFYRDGRHTKSSSPVLCVAPTARVN